ncbi:MAG: protein kinase [Deltaproteobacteria bacterium]|nr:protein kinase [Deltaproteobacteria bacterium]
MICPHCSSEVVNDARFCGACGKASSSTETQSTPLPAGDVYAAMIGREIAGRYRITKKLGEGGMGAVFRAEQISLKRACAVKLLRPGLAGNQAMLRRFNAEAEAVAKLSHPNTVNIYDFGQDTDGTLFIAMEYVEGKSLREVIQETGPLPVGRALAIASQIAASLTDAHLNSIVHRDLKPDNVMLSERGRHKDVVRVLDFGIAKLRDESRSGLNAMTQAGDMLGTPQYMAPEQIRGEAIDGRADVYALGCLMYEMLTGRMAFEAPTIMAMLSKHLVEEVEAPSKRRPDLNLSPAVDQLVLAALIKDPARRPATMELFGEQITALYQTLPADARSGASSVMSTPMSAVMGVPSPTPSTAGFAPTMPPPSTPAPFGGMPATAHAGPPPQLAPSPFAAPPVPPYSPPAPYSSPAPYSPYVPPVTIAPQATAKPDRSMLYMIIIVVAVLGGTTAYFMASGEKGLDEIDFKPDPDDTRTFDQRMKDIEKLNKELEQYKDTE